MEHGGKGEKSEKGEKRKELEGRSQNPVGQASLPAKE